MQSNLISVVVLANLVLTGLFGVEPNTRQSKTHDSQTGNQARNFRPTETAQLVTGIFFMKETVINGEQRKIHYFTDYKTGKTYEISDQCDQVCMKAITDCEGQEICRIKAEFREGQKSTAVIKSFVGVVSAETKETESGAKFTRVSPKELEKLGVTEIGKFGEAWRDPYGRVWGDVAKDENGQIRLMTKRDAEDYCRSIGAGLPTGYRKDQNGSSGKDSDYVRLRKYMGIESRGILVRYGNDSDKYTPQILPNLGVWPNEWSESPSPDMNHFGYIFNARSGEIKYGDLATAKLQVRCIVGAR